MNLKPLLLPVLALTLAATAFADTRCGDDSDRDDRRDHRRRARREQAERRHRERDREDEDRRERRHCDDDVVIVYSEPAPPWFAYYPPLWAAPQTRFCPIPIPRRPVFILPGMK
jgi:hypothetical protein